MRIPFIPMYPEAGPCPQCTTAARFEVIAFDSRMIRVECSGNCGCFELFLRHPDDQPSIGIILCKMRERFVAEYALRDINKPIGISEYWLSESLPEKLQGCLPTIEELENELGAASESDSK